MKNITLLLACCLLVFGAVNAFAQTTDLLKVDYFANANTTGAPDATMRLDNPGTYSPTGANGNLCASIFVFDVHQEMSECCSCLLTPDGLRTLSVNADLTSNPLTGVTLSTGVIKVVATKPRAGNCPLPSSNPLNPVAALRSWVTHIQSSSSNWQVTETGSQDAALSAAEAGALVAQCHSIAIVGSGRGVCSCGTGD